MKNIKPKILFAVISMLLLSSVLSGCGTIYRPSSWPGISVSTDGETAYVAYNQQVYALNDNGLQQWAYPEDQGNMNYYAEPLETSDGGLVIGTYDNNLVKVNAESGALVWEFKDAGNRYIGSASEADGVIYAPNADNSMYAINLDGTLVWQFETEQANWAKPLVNGELVYVVSMDHYVYALNRSTQAMAWKTDLGTAAMSSPVFNEDQSVIFLGTYGSKVMALNASTGNIIWETAEDVIPGWVWGSPVYADGVIYATDSAGTAAALDANTGNLLWTKSFNNAITGSALLLDGVIYIATEAGELAALDAETGVQQWMQTFEGQFHGTPKAFGEVILVGVVEGADGVVVQAFNPNGTQRWSFKPAN